MSFSGDDNSKTPMTLNPVFAFWAMPYIMAQAWMTSWLKMGSRQDAALEPHAETTPATGAGQIPVPAPLQEDAESKMFA